MLVSTFTRSYRNTSLWWLESSHRHLQNIVLKRLNFLTAVEFSTLNTKSDLNSTTLSKNDNETLGCLQKNSESSKFKREMKILPDAKIIKMKKEIKYNPNNDPDIFGNLSNKDPVWYSDIKEKPIIDNNQSDDSTLVRNMSKNYRLPEVYIGRMKDLVAQKKLKEALELFVEMRRNFVAPMHQHYTFMISACGRVGYTEMAFKLFRQMTDRGMKPTSATLTSLFNACAECPFPEYGLKKAFVLKEKIQPKNWVANQITYHSMIKAFGKCGDIQTAFQVVDEMAKAGVKIDVATYSFLLMSCISNKDTGFTHAIEVWRKMQEKRCTPNCFSFNLLLQAARDCDIGSHDISCLLLQHWSSFSTRPYGFQTKESFEKKKYLQVEKGNVVDLPSEPNEQLQHQDTSHSENKYNTDTRQDTEITRTQNTAVINVLDSFLNVLHQRPLKGSEVLDIGNIKTASDRLTLIGGVKGILKDMKDAYANPDIKTFTLLLECLPPNIEFEEELMSLFDVYSVKPDIGFFNVLIKRRNCRFDYTEAQHVLLLINKWCLSPDVITYGVLAMSCKTHIKATVFLNDMKKLGFPLNTEIIGALLSCACTAIDFNYMQNILQVMAEERVKPNSKMLSKLESTLDYCRKNIINLEHGKEVPNVFKRKGFAFKYKEFCDKYDKWLKEVKFDKEEHVWTQYKTDIFERLSVKEF